MIDLGESDGLLLVDDSERNADLYYATKFRAPDPFVFLHTGTKSYLLIGDLELDRARQEADVDEVLSVSHYARQVKKSKDEAGSRPPSRSHQILLAAINDVGGHIRSLRVPAQFPVETADFLRHSGIRLDVAARPLFEQRSVKQPHEVEAIRRALRAAETGMAVALESIGQARVEEAGVLSLEGEALTSQRLRRLIHHTLLEEDFSARHTIVACGDDGCDPHCEGSGPLVADRPIIVDIFPRSDSSGYYGDLTRTVVRGDAGDELRRAYEAVLAAQQVAFDHIRNGCDGNAIHQSVERSFSARGYETGERDGRLQGFFHGTGHGLGLDIHEAPSIGSRRDILRTGQIVTVEPGLYYLGQGGVRLEDVVIVTEDGCENLTRFPKVLEV